MRFPTPSSAFPPQALLTLLYTLYYFPTPNQQPEKTAVLLAPSEEGRLFSQAAKSIVILKNPENIRLFPDKEETNEETNFLDELSVGH